jgi:hypothetical protein
MPDLVYGRVAHVVPGRMRLRIDRRDLNPKFSDVLRSAFLAMPDVEEVRIQPLTGSITIVSRRSGLTPRVLAERLVTLGLLDLDPTTGDPDAGKQKPMSDTARSIHDAFHGVDMRLAEITKGRWDLRTVVPFAFGAFAVRQFIAEAGAIGAAPWYVLAWYAFDSFWKLNQRSVVVEHSDDLSDE